MCATVRPSQALFFGTREQIEQMRPQSMPVNTFQFGNQTITTRVFTMVPKPPHDAIAPRALYIDVTSAMEEEASSRNPRNVRLNVIGDGSGAPLPVMMDDPYAEVIL